MSDKSTFTTICSTIQYTIPFILYHTIYYWTLEAIFLLERKGQYRSCDSILHSKARYGRTVFYSCHLVLKSFLAYTTIVSSTLEFCEGRCPNIWLTKISTYDHFILVKHPALWLSIVKTVWILLYCTSCYLIIISLQVSNSDVLLYCVMSFLQDSSLIKYIRD